MAKSAIWTRCAVAPNIIYDIATIIMVDIMRSVATIIMCEVKVLHNRVYILIHLTLWLYKFLYRSKS